MKGGKRKGRERGGRDGKGTPEGCDPLSSGRPTGSAGVDRGRKPGLKCGGTAQCTNRNGK